ncbi:hypothetical protein IQ229_02275 [Nostoc cf. edaphicum LEGE 07299]|uniref:KAP NTPase domain-containing protein n=1 Tax=Nostoc cf. edaphicum LEGE 07299 TaxID=2777974 RepID=A0ABR9TTS5_9NOSO|nr:plasmid replication protein, CyRepA1 family [Nostoc edaphicum]MBE9103810.1 hypothetical protein [Nostoc cf. edaphicum LEGE 07299]
MPDPKCLFAKALQGIKQQKKLKPILPQERGIFYNVNGGRSNNAVNRFYANFFEHDKGTKEERRKKIYSFPLRPTLIITTRRSSHTYDVLNLTSDQYKNLDIWKEYQEKRAYYMGSDPSIKDLPRLMRLAGFDHVKVIEDYCVPGGLEIEWTTCELIHYEPENKYTLKELDDAFEQFAVQEGIKLFSKERFNGYQFMNSKLNQKKKGVNYSHEKFNPDIFRRCNDSEVTELLKRAQILAKLREREKAGKPCDRTSESAWTDPIESAKLSYESQYDFDLIDNSNNEFLKLHGVDSGETEAEYFARKYGFGYSHAGEQGGRQHWHTCQCPYHGSSSGSEDNLHIAYDDPNYPRGTIVCQSGDSAQDVMIAFRQLAQDAGDPLWDKTWTKCDRTKKQDYQKTKDDYFVDYEAKRNKVARHSFATQADILVNIGYFPDIKLKDLPRGLIGIKGDWGTGKSHLIASLIKQYPYNKVIQIGHLNRLLFNTSEKYGLTHHHLAREQKWGMGGCDRLAITDISVGALLKTENYLEQRYVLVLDEIEQILNSLVNNKNLKGNLRMTYFRKLVWFISNAEYIIFADADLSDATLDFIEAIRNADKVGREPEKTFIIHHTKKQGLGRKIKISNDKGATLKRLYESLSDGQKIIAPFENKSDLLALQKSTLNDEFRKSTDIIHGENSQEEQIREYIKNIDSLYKSNNLFYTGTLGTGIDLSRPHYDKRFGIFTGDVFAASDQCQQFSRYRPDCDSEIFCDTKKRNFKIDADQLVLELINKNNESNTYFCDNISQLIEAGFYPNPDGTFDEYDQAFLKLWGVINARSNASRANPYQTLVDRLTDAGYELEFLDDSEDKTENDGVLSSHKATKSELKTQEDIAKAEARVLTDDEYIDAIRQKGNLDKQKQREVYKTRLAKTLGIPIDAGIVKLERTRKITTGLTLLHILLTDDESAIAFEMRDRKLNPIVTDRSHFLKKRELLKKLQIPEFLAFLNAGNNYSKSSDWAKFIAKTARANYKAMDSWLSIKIKFEKDKEGFKQSDAEIVGLILAKLGVLTTNENKRVGGGWEREYEIDKPYWEIVFSTILPYMDSRKPQQDDYLEGDNRSEVFDPAHPERYCIPKFSTLGNMAEMLAT